MLAIIYALPCSVAWPARGLLTRRTIVLVPRECRDAHRTHSVRCALQQSVSSLLHSPAGNTGSALAPRRGRLLAACRAGTAPA